MMSWIVGSSLKSRRIVVALSIAAMVVGFSRLRDMPRDVLPEFIPPTVEVQTEALGLSTAEVEELITVPLEQDLLNGVAFLESIRSQSMPGLSSIQMIFEPGTDLLDARQVVEERLTQAHALPQVSKPPQMLQPLSSTSRVMMVGLSSDRVSLIDMSILARWNIRPRLMGVPGVANVAVWGERDRQLQVLVDPGRLRAHGVSLQQIVETTANAQFVSNLTFVEASTPGTGGIIETASQRFGIQHTVPFASPDDLAKVMVERTEGAPVRLGDVTTIVVDHQQLIGDAVTSDGSGLLLVIEKLPGVNALDITKGVQAALDDLAPGLSGIKIDPSLFQPATFIQTSTDNLVSAFFIGGFLLLLALGGLLFQWRTALAALLAIVASLLTAALILSMMGTTLNSMIVAGLILGIVVVIDDAINHVEHVAWHIRRRPMEARGESLTRLLIQTTLSMRSAGIYAALITLAVFVPVLFTRDALGAFFPSIALSYAVAVLASMLVALVVTPPICLILLRRVRADSGESPFVRWVRRHHQRGLLRVTESMRPGLALLGFLLIAGLVAVPFLRWSLTPSFKDSNLLVGLRGAPGTSLPEMERITARLGNEILTLPGVRSVGGHAGRAVLSDQRVGTNASELWVRVDLEADYDSTRASIEDVVYGYPGLSRSVLTYPEQRIKEVLSGSIDPITVRLFGQDLDVLRGKAAEIQLMLSGIDGVQHPRVQGQEEEPSLQVAVDLDAAALHQIVPGDVRRAAATLLSGIQVGSLFDEQKVFDVVVWGTPEIRHDVSALQGLSIDTRARRPVRLGDVADVRVSSFPSAIQHVDVSRSIDITADVSGRDVGAVSADIERRLKDVRFPIEYHAELLGDFEERQAAHREVVGFAVAAAIAILLLIQGVIGNWRMAALIFMMLPFGLAGGAVAALLDGHVVSLGSVAGFLAVLGLSARHAVLQVKHYQQLERENSQSFGRELVLRGAGERLAPVLTSSLTVALSLAPLAIAGTIAGLEIVNPMAVVILGGMVSSTVLTLLIIPALYLRFGFQSEPDLTLVLAEPAIDLATAEQTEPTHS